MVYLIVQMRGRAIIKKLNSMWSAGSQTNSKLVKENTAMSRIRLRDCNYPQAQSCHDCGYCLNWIATLSAESGAHPPPRETT